MNIAISFKLDNYITWGDSGLLRNSDFPKWLSIALCWKVKFYSFSIELYVTSWTKNISFHLFDNNYFSEMIFFVDLSATKNVNIGEYIYFDDYLLQNISSFWYWSSFSCLTLILRVLSSKLRSIVVVNSHTFNVIVRVFRKIYIMILYDLFESRTTGLKD